jgi:hypothetical protein
MLETVLRLELWSNSIVSGEMEMGTMRVGSSRVELEWWVGGEVRRLNNKRTKSQKRKITKISRKKWKSSHCASLLSATLIKLSQNSLPKLLSHPFHFLDYESNFLCLSTHLFAQQFGSLPVFAFSLTIAFFSSTLQHSQSHPQSFFQQSAYINSFSNLDTIQIATDLGTGLTMNNFCWSCLKLGPAKWLPWSHLSSSLTVSWPDLVSRIYFHCGHM